MTPARPWSEALRGAVLSLVLLAALLLCWHLATPAPKAAAHVDPEYAELMGGSPAVEGGSVFPSPSDVGRSMLALVRDPFYVKGENDKGIAHQLLASLWRVLKGFAYAALIAVPVGFLIGMSPVAYRAFDPFIQVLKPISPLAWMPLALYTIKDADKSSVFVIFICSVWPMLINTAHGVAGVRREWLNVARTLEVGPLRTALCVILPAAAPTILTGMRISVSVAWLVIVAAEMLVGGTGVGTFVWNEWNNLSLSNMICAIVLIGVVGMLLDQGLRLATKAVTHGD